MMCCRIDVKRSIEAFQKDFQFIKTLYKVNPELEKQSAHNSSRTFVISGKKQCFELSRRQIEVMAHMKCITSRTQIALKMKISIKTLERHLLIMRKKMRCNTVKAMFELVQGGMVVEGSEGNAG
ncbi:MAG: hypothetical protein P1U63_06430 [Coxiellaceae bacterium]|nr:hypothetical protein [Coxiellaceae bacterium]